MIRYALACAGGHEYESWFRDSADFDEQARRGLVECPACGATDVRKRVMAPNVATSRKREAASKEQARVRQAMAETAKAVRKHIASNFDDVGGRFPDEARAIHLGEAPARAIYGEASPEEARALRDEGVEIAPPAALPQPATVQEAELTRALSRAQFPKR